MESPAARPRIGQARPRPTRAARTPNLNHPTYYLNRELSWIEFNARVLEEALDEGNPLLERVRFLSIFGNNLDEFFMVRVSGLRRQLATGVVTSPPDGMSPAAQLTAIRERLLPLLETSVACWRERLAPGLAAAGIQVLSWEELKKRQRRLLRRHFHEQIFPVLTPLAFDPGHPFPHISSLSLNLAVVIRHPDGSERFARLKVPQSLPRLLRVPDEDRAGDESSGLAEVTSFNFVRIEEVVAANLDMLFPGLEVVAAHTFRVTRDADLEIEEDEAGDLLTAMAEVVERRHFGSAVRLEVDSAMPAAIRDILVENLQLQPFLVYTTPAPIGLSGLAGLAELEVPELRFPPFQPSVPAGLGGDDDFFATVRRRDVLLYHPYDSFQPVVELLRRAAVDPEVVAIKQTLYRVGRNSPIVEALMEARQNGKQVSVLVELKARFDEERNITWARSLERTGVHVVYGVVGLKTHAKVCLVVRREGQRLRRYLHLGTGNYNPATARVYTDLGLLTCEEELAADASDLFNGLTGYSRKDRYGRLLVAPGRLRRDVLSRIEREIAVHREQGGGHILLKMNSLVDRLCIRALYEASAAGVKVELLVRGICCLKPGLPRVSENITVTSIVGRFLEHARIYYFHNGGDEEVFLGSADLMPRNLDGRVETLFPIQEARLRRAIRDHILGPQLRDTARARRLEPDGTWRRLTPAEGADAFDAQRHLLEVKAAWHVEEEAPREKVQ